VPENGYSLPARTTPVGEFSLDTLQHVQRAQTLGAARIPAPRATRAHQ
jgi:hypothetical protein